MAALCWSVWLCRNKCIFNQEVFSIQKLLALIFHLIYEWTGMNCDFEAMANSELVVISDGERSMSDEDLLGSS